MNNESIEEGPSCLISGWDSIFREMVCNDQDIGHSTTTIL